MLKNYSALIQDLKSKDWRKRNAAVDKLATAIDISRCTLMGECVVHLLSTTDGLESLWSRFLESEESYITLVQELDLGDSPKPLIQILEACDDDLSVRGAVVDVLTKIGPSAVGLFQAEVEGARKQKIDKYVGKLLRTISGERLVKPLLAILQSHHRGTGIGTQSLTRIRHLHDSFPNNSAISTWLVQIERPLLLGIEDEPEMNDLSNLILSRKGWTFLGAYGGREGLRQIRFLKPDLVLLDLMMPDMDGWEVFQQMKADDELKDIPVIVVTAKAQSIDKVLGLRIVKVDDYVTKPFGPHELLQSVAKVLQVREPREQERLDLVARLQALTFERNQLRERWQVSQVNAELAQFIDEFAKLTTGTIHDLRSGVEVIRVNVQKLHDARGKNQPTHDELDRMTRAARYCALLIENLSEIKFKGEFQPRPLDIRESVQRVLSLVKSKNPGVKFVYRSSDTLPKVDADARQLEQVLLNLVRAATKSRTEAGEISIVIKPDRKGAGVHLEITGVDQDASLTKTFDLNATDKQGNYNVELYIAKKIVDRHNGELATESLQGENGGFALWLPDSQEKRTLSVKDLQAQLELVKKEITALERQIKDNSAPGQARQLPQEIDKLVRGIVADLFNELGIIESTVGARLRVVTRAGSLYKRLLRVSQVCEYCQLLAKNLLTLGPGEEPAYQPIDVEHVLRDVVSMLDNKILPHIEQRWDVDSAIPKVLGDELGLKQVFVNLVINALEAMPQDKPGKLDLRIRQEGDWALIDIIDNGCGISLENQKKLFDFRFTTKPTGEGGIGLYVVKSIIDQLCGSVKVESREGQGAKFTVRLPVEKETL